MVRRGTDRHWQAWGERDPWYGVLSEDRFRGGADRDAFLASGEAHVARVLARCASLGLPVAAGGMAGGVALDYGCGVGRLLAPLSARFARVVGVDVAPAMLRIAREDVVAGPVARGVVELREGSADQPGVLREDDRFAFIHTALVLQHLPVRRGLEVLARLLAHLAPGGVAVIQAPYRARRRERYLLNQVRASHQVLFDLSRVLLGQRDQLGEPVMQMKAYPPPAVQRVAAAAGVGVHWVELDRDPFDYLDLAIWYLQRPAAGADAHTGIAWAE